MELVAGLKHQESFRRCHRSVNWRRRIELRGPPLLTPFLFGGNGLLRCFFRLMIPETATSDPSCLMKG